MNVEIKELLEKSISIQTENNTLLKKIYNIVSKHNYMKDFGVNVAADLVAEFIKYK